jgi:hypothetical protein
VKRKPTRRDGGTVGIVAVIAMMGFLGWFEVLPMWRAHRSLDWTPATCKIVGTGHATHHDRKGKPYDVLVVEYTYDAGGQTYHGSRIDFSGRDGAAYEDVSANAARGDQVPCWYDPSDADQAVLVRTAWAPGFASWFMFGILVIFSAACAALLRPARGDRDSLVPIVPRVVLAAMLIAIAYFACDGGTGAATATALTTIAVASVTWTVTTVRRWHRGGLPEARVQSQ